MGDNLALMPLSKAHTLLRALKKRSVRPTTAFRGALKIGPSSYLPVWSWRKVCKTAAIQMKNISKAALEDEDAAADPGGTVVLERRAYVIDQSGAGEAGGVTGVGGEPQEREVKPEDRINAYRYGRDLVPVSAMEEDELKLGVADKCLELIGFVSQEEVPVRCIRCNLMQ